MTKKKPNSKTLQAMAEAEGILRAQQRLAVMAQVMETPLADLESFLDLLAEEPLTPARITDAQYVMGLPTPVLSHLTFPKMADPPFGRKLLAEWLSRREYFRVAAEVEAMKSDHVVEANEMIERATEVLGSHEKARRWMESYNRALGASPISLLNDDTGIQAVEAVLTRIEFGVFD